MPGARRVFPGCGGRLGHLRSTGRGEGFQLSTSSAPLPGQLPRWILHAGVCGFHAAATATRVLSRSCARAHRDSASTPTLSRARARLPSCGDRSDSAVLFAVPFFDEEAVLEKLRGTAPAVGELARSHAP